MDVMQGCNNEYRYKRVVVDRIDDELIDFHDTDGNEGQAFYAFENEYGQWEALRPLVHCGTQLNLVGIGEAQDKGTPKPLRPLLFILEPDYLLDISSLASTTETGSPFQFFLNKFLPAVSSVDILLGNFASQLLDETVHRPTLPCPYAESINKFFRSNLFDFLSCEGDLRDFHSRAAVQQNNIRRIYHQDLSNRSFFHSDEVLLEPTFFCEMLGLQGRMDLLQRDYRLLIEQKSGKKDWLGGYREAHYVQMLLYQALLHFNFHLPFDRIHSFLLYSKYSDGLLALDVSPRLIGEAIMLRNRIVANEFFFATHPAEETLLRMKAEDLRQNSNITDKFWHQWMGVKYEHLLNSLQSADALSQAYFFRFFRFLQLEQTLSRTDFKTQSGHDLSSLWSQPVEEKKQEGNIIDALRIEVPETGEEIPSVCLRYTCISAEDGFSPISTSNFRQGDSIIFYSYEDSLPDARKTCVIRGTIRTVGIDFIDIILRTPQKDIAIFDFSRFYALEHDHINTFHPLFRGLFSLLTATPRRRRVLLNRCRPNVLPSFPTSADFGTLQTLVERVMQAEDFFLIVGPPGSGKTSFALMNIVKESLHRGDTILLSAYTNRAVDEICEKLVNHGIDFLRMGKAELAPEVFRPYFLEQKLGERVSLSEAKRVFREARIVVGTVASLSNQMSLFRLKTFDLAIFDEASQLLEPHLLPILTARNGEEDAVRRFVLIGDHKQLPAVVRQSGEDSRVSEKSLQEIGLDDCRNSLFHRLFRLYKEDDSVVYFMSLQGRMHPDVSDFINTSFYEGKLKPVPLPHQAEPLSFGVCPSPLSLQLACHRFLFFNVQPQTAVGGNYNKEEAKLAADIVNAFNLLYRENRLDFNAEKTIGVIVPYRNQISIIRRHLYDLFSSEQHAFVEKISIDTVERYQGSERDIIVYGLTAQTEWQLDFITAEQFEEDGRIIDRKLNVALSRARKQLIVIGNADLACKNPVLSKLVSYAKSHEAFIGTSNIV